MKKPLPLALSLICAVLAVSPARAVDFQEEADNAAKAGFVELGKLSTFRAFVKAAGSANFRDMKVSHVKALTNAIAGEVTFFGRPSHILIYNGGGAKSAFVAIEPAQILTFADLFGDKGKLFDSLPAEKSLIALAVGDVELEAGDLPPDVRGIMGRFFPEEDFTLKVDQGVNIITLTDLGRSKTMSRALKVLGGKGSKIAVRVSVEGNVLDGLLEGHRPIPSLKLEAALPPFQPYLFGKIRFPAAVRLELEGAVAAHKESAELGLAAPFTFDHAKGEQPVQMVLSAGVSQEKGEEPAVTVSAGMPEGVPFVHAFGVKWLTLQDYKMSFSQKGVGPLTIAMTGSTSFGEKAIALGGSVLVAAETEGLPIPKTLHFSVNDGDDKVGSLSLLDIVRAFEYISQENGRKVYIDKKRLPDLAIAGTEVGQGPSIEVNLKGADDTGFDISGKLRVLGNDIADVDRAFLDSDQGFQLTANTKKVAGLGPLTFPNVTVDVAFVASKDDRSFEEPRIVFKTTDGELFGAKSSLQFVIRPGEYRYVSDQDYGSLFKFSFAAYTPQRMRTFADLAKADFFMDSDLTTDPGVWIRTTGEQVVRDAFTGLTSDAAAKKAVDDLNAQIRVVEGQIQTRENQIKAQRRQQQESIDAARNQVNALQRDIDAEDATIGSLSAQANRSCDQTKSVCVWYDIFRGECTKHATVADVGARASCNWNRGVAATQLVGAEAARAALVASKGVADKTLAAVQRGLNDLPLDLDPEVASDYAKRDALELSLATAQQTLTEFGKAGASLAAGLDVLGGAAGRFAIKRARVQGDLRAAINGKPVVLTLDYVLDGRHFRDRLAYSITDAAYNEAQMKTWVLGVAVHAMMEAEHGQSVIPFQFLDAAVAKFEKDQAAARVEQEKALANLHEPVADANAYPSSEDSVAAVHSGLAGAQSRSRTSILNAAQARLGAKRDRRAAPLIVNSGDLLLYKLNGDGTFGALPIRIGFGWGGFTKVFGGADKRVYAIDASGVFRAYYQNSTGGFYASKQTGSGWSGFRRVVDGPPGYVYAFDNSGNMLAYNMTPDGAFIGSRKVGGGWGGCAIPFSNGHDSLYCIHPNGDLYYYSMLPGGGVVGGRKIGSGWTSDAAHVFAVRGGVIYLIDKSGELFYYRHDQNQNFVSGHVLAGSGWDPYYRVFSNGTDVYAIRK